MATNTAPLSTARTPSLSKQPKYYEADGALRAYANISVWAAVIAGVVALVAVAIMIFMRIQPPTVIRVLADRRGDCNWFGWLPQNDDVAGRSERNSGGPGPHCI